MPIPTIKKIERCILLLGDHWNSISGGIAGVNRSLALSLSSYKGIKLYCALLDPIDQLSRVDREEADKHNVTFVSPSISGVSTKELYTKLNENPLEIFQDITEQVPYVTHIVGHSPITAEAAVKLKEEVYNKAKVVLFYHVIPKDVEWMCESLPYVIPTDTEQVRLAEKADVVYSVTEKLHWFYTAKFRNRANKDIDHRLFLPQCSEQVFSVTRKPSSQGDANILVLSTGGDMDVWQGLDISACGVNKVTIASSEKSQGRPIPSLRIGGVKQENSEQVKNAIRSYITDDRCKFDVKPYDAPQELFDDLQNCTICLVPSRAEPYGYLGLYALSAGIPTLIAEDSALASIIRRLTSEPEYFLVPVTPTASAVRQDGSMWRDRIMAMLQDPETAHERALQLRNALRRDEPTKESHDNFITYCLGESGIRLRHEATAIRFIYFKDEDKELPVMRSLNDFLLATLKQCWRLKHHPLTTTRDLFQLLPGVDLPTKELMTAVTDKIEEYDRRIVGVDDKTSSFIVYCPTPEALSDLWAMCDVINRSLVDILLSGDQNEVLPKFKLKKASVRTIIDGPEFLTYKQTLVKDLRD